MLQPNAQGPNTIANAEFQHFSVMLPYTATVACIAKYCNKDTACSSSLVCCNMAMAALRNSACTGALVLGVNVQFNPYWTEAAKQSPKQSSQTSQN